MAPNDLRDVAADAATLALAIGSSAPEAGASVSKSVRNLPFMSGVLATLQRTRKTLEAVRVRKEEFEALAQKITYVAACVIVKYNHLGVKQLRKLDPKPLAECADAIEIHVKRSARRGKLVTALRVVGNKNAIAELYARVDRVTQDVGVADIVAVFKGVLADQGNRSILTADQARLAKQPKRASRQASLPSSIPSRPRWHVPRQRVMRMVLQSLLYSSRAPRLVGLVGESGSGKSTTAAEVARSAEVREFFPDGVLWLSMGEGVRDCLESVLIRLATMVRRDIVDRGGNGVGDAGAIEDGDGYVKRVVYGPSTRTGRALRCLVVVDDAWDQEVLERIRDTGMWVLATTRLDHIVRGAGGEPVRIDRMFKADAEAVLRQASDFPPGVGSANDSKELIEICGRVAMDLAYVGIWSTAERKKHDRAAWSSALTTIRAELRDPTLAGEHAAADDRAEARRSRRHADSADTVSLSLDSSSDCSVGEDTRAIRRKAVLRAGFRALVASSEDPRAQKLYLALAVLPDGHEFSLKHAAILLSDRDWTYCDTEQVNASRTVVATLERWTVVSSRGDTFYCMHDAHSSFAREILKGRSDLRQAAIRRWAAFISSLDALLSFDSITLARLWTAVERVGGRGWRSLRPYETALASLDDTDGELLRAGAEAIAKFRDAQGDLDGASVMWRTVLAIERKAADPKPAYPMGELVKSTEKMGKRTERLFGSQDSRDIEEMLRRALEREATEPRADPERLAFMLQQLGVCCRQAGRFDEAQQFLRRALESERSRSKPDDAQVARTVFHLGLCLRQAGQLEEAEEVLRESLGLETAMCSPNDLHIARSSDELGLCLRLSGKFPEAERHLTRALGICDATSGRSDKATARTLHELGTCVRQAGRPQDAEALLRRALRLKEAADDTSDESLARSMFQLGVCVYQNGHIQESEVLLKNVLALEEARVGGKDDVAVARVAFHLGACLRRGGRCDDAASMLERALRTLTAKFGKENREVITVEEMLISCDLTE